MLWALRTGCELEQQELNTTRLNRGFAWSGGANELRVRRRLLVSSMYGSADWEVGELYRQVWDRENRSPANFAVSGDRKG
jgi:hypothetical protein